MSKSVAHKEATSVKDTLKQQIKQLRDGVKCSVCHHLDTTVMQMLCARGKSFPQLICAECFFHWIEEAQAFNDNRMATSISVNTSKKDFFITMQSCCRTCWEKENAERNSSSSNSNNVMSLITDNHCFSIRNSLAKLNGLQLAVVELVKAQIRDNLFVKEHPEFEGENSYFQIALKKREVKVGCKCNETVNLGVSSLITDIEDHFYNNSHCMYCQKCKSFTRNEAELKIHQQLHKHEQAVQELTEQLNKKQKIFQAPTIVHNNNNNNNASMDDSEVIMYTQLSQPELYDNDEIVCTQPRN